MGRSRSPAWTFKGFYQPVDMGGIVNTVKSGSTVPLKFEVFKGTTELTSTSNVVMPLKAVGVACGTGAGDHVELTATGGTALRYDAARRPVHLQLADAIEGRDLLQRDD